MKTTIKRILSTSLSLAVIFGCSSMTYLTAFADNSKSVSQTSEKSESLIKKKNHN